MQLSDFEGRIILISEDHSSQISDAKFEPDKHETLVYLKLVSMNANSLKNNEHKIDRVFGPAKGFLIHGKCLDLRDYLHCVVDAFMDQAIKDAESNP